MNTPDPNHPRPEARPQHGYGQLPAYTGNQEGHGRAQAGSGGYHQQYLHHHGSQPGAPVGFGEAVKRFYSQYAQFSGRASRSEYWWVFLYLAIISTVISVLGVTVGTSASGQPNGIGDALSMLELLFAVVHIVPNLALGARRLHDTNRSGWFQLIALIPFLGVLVLLVLFALSPKREGARFDR